jgi:uncharacterized membrane protein
MTRSTSSTSERSGRSVLSGLLDLRPRIVAEPRATHAEEAVAQPRAANVYAFASVDYPGAAQSQVFDSDGTTAVGSFVFDPASTPATAFTFTDGTYRILPVPGSTESVATGITGAGLIVGNYQDLSGVRHGFADDGTALTTVDFPGARATQAMGVNAAGQIVGEYVDAADVEHGFLSTGGTFTAIDYPGAIATVAVGINVAGDIVGVFADTTATRGFLLRGGTFTPIDFPLAGRTIAFGISDTGEIAGLYDDAAGSHGFVHADGAFSAVDVAGARGTGLTRIKDGMVTGFCTDALTATHGLTGR